MNGAIYCDCVGTSEAEPFIVKGLLCLCTYHSTEICKKFVGGSCKLHLPVGLVRKPVRVFIYSKVMCNFSLVPVLSCGGEERVPDTYCAHMRQVPLVTCICQVCLLTEKPHWMVIFPLRHIGQF